MRAPSASRFDFANILFAGPCNRFCPFCIGNELPARVKMYNLDRFPLRGLDQFVDEVNQYGIRQIVFTGTNTDPLLYRYQSELLRYLRENLRTNPYVSLHTNGALALRLIDTVNMYDKVCLSFPSFNPTTYQKMMGVPKVPNLEGIIERAKIEVKISCLINQHNIFEVEEFLGECARIGVKRVVLRRLYGERREWALLPGEKPIRYYRSNPVYQYRGMEVTYWNFDSTQSTSINLFSDGTLSSDYLLTVGAPGNSSQLSAQQIEEFYEH